MSDHLARAKDEAGRHHDPSLPTTANSPDERTVPYLLAGLLDAQIALVEEQRTANLIAILTARDASGQSALDMHQLGSAIRQIEQRLGLLTPPGQPA